MHADGRRWKRQRCVDHDRQALAKMLVEFKPLTCLCLSYLRPSACICGFIEMPKMPALRPIFAENSPTAYCCPARGLVKIEIRELSSAFDQEEPSFSCISHGRSSAPAFSLPSRAVSYIRGFSTMAV